ncbi:hypothetical protein FHR24_003085 [Wenyingzhuangia heitensis]|uniref:Uncharacterized protein n=1 Tax=Wenyingzhuangia heitensis TaxID=1487859 RepID=A0ABX0UFE3_9FLAO|nr:hypothetical protein [Wenyingzhuangia heitensis]NIJ46595.1 hypothetical protein [Wenyingzhuangia heitensis]
MAKNKENLSFQDVFEEHPIKSCIGSFTIGIGLTYTIMSFLYENRIENVKNRYEDKIEYLKRNHVQDLEINEIKLINKHSTKFYLNIDPDSKLANEITNLINSKNEK